MSGNQPLAARMRPISLDQIVGQAHLIFPGSPLELLADGKGSTSVLLWGPPGVGKTTIASVVAHRTSRRFVELSATSAGVADVRKTLAAAHKALEKGEQTLVFIDEIHRFSKAQQDVLLPAVESGLISLIGATTENPSFSVNSALISRSILLVLRPVENSDVVILLSRALKEDPVLSTTGIGFEDSALDIIADLSSGDVRQALNRLETAMATAQAAGKHIIDREVLEQVTGFALQRYDRDGDQHYDIISAFIKSLRGSDPDAALHWLARMIEAGEDPRFIARRLVVHASEDVGMADPSVLGIAVAAAQAVQLIGLPEARVNLAQATIAIATAPKSNAAYRGIDAALADVRSGRTGEVPRHLRDSHYPGAKALGHGKSYLYPHDFEHAVAVQQYLPDAVLGTKYYRPTVNGFEQTVTNRLASIAAMTRKE
ncbi:replication-associated recombination protein A [Pseudarthrobacter sp. GA104]|uniref:replication-associated recombination protein A n=1 Tax=Pseudarthrobacter sp. GA104 TaxID=2676311 RepID=UPI0012F8B75C|nr:replication-associated recombination protein A [Pseudarthrobacter sp. GA104]MUU73457.1 AAA family ATPase [Pseudarthrobacter sp. GA104]